MDGSLNQTVGGGLQKSRDGTLHSTVALGYALKRFILIVYFNFDILDHWFT